MESEIHTVLGASGATGRAVVQELQNRRLTIRVVERSFKIRGIETVKADLLKLEEAINAIKDSKFVYLCVGLPYNSDIWLRDWPLLMKNVIDACLHTNATLVFFDNVYMYGHPPLFIPFDENHPQIPVTKKGLARKQTVDILLKSIKEDGLKAVVGRSADFYGPYAVNSLFYISFLERMLKNKAPQWLSKTTVKHTYANSTDNGKALVLLALDPTTYGQVWHLPVGLPITIEEVMDIFNKELGTNFKISVVSPMMRNILSLFIPVLREASEMLYQFNEEYVMSFSKFKNHFPDFKVTPYQQGIKEMIASFKTS